MPQARRKKQPKKIQIRSKFSVLTRETLLIFFGAISLYMFIALATYSAQDPSWSHSGSPERITNMGGRFGAWFADILLQGFGHMAVLFPLFFATLGWRLYKYQKHESMVLQKRVLLVVGFILTLVGGAGLDYLHFASPSGITTFTAGGLLGISVSHALVTAFGFVGATVFLLVMFTSGITWLTDLSWFRLMDVIGKWAFDVIDWIREQLYYFLDQVTGLRARQSRKSNVSKIREREQVRSKKSRVRIEPRIEPDKASERVEEEKQSDLFEDIDPASLRPPLSLLDEAPESKNGYSEQALETLSRLVEKKLSDFNIEVRVVEVHPGPVITRFEVETAPGTKASHISNLARDLARSLSVISVRVVENIPGKTFVGLEIPNENREIVRLIDGLSSHAYENANTSLALMLGKDIGGQPVITDLSKMPHLLIAGTTGSGKSVCINALILSLLYKSTPDQVRLIMIDPKMLELSVYEGVPHLLAPVVTDMQEAANSLRWGIVEMDRRYRLMAALGVRNIAGFNRKVEAAMKAGKTILDPLIDPGEKAEPLQTVPFIVIIIDELADLMMVVGKKVEDLITRIAQKARAAGIHLILATQRPSVDVITGLIKANIPARIAFQVSSRVDSRTVLDQMGAEQLLGHGDMLFLPPGSSLPVRVHGSYVDDQEVHRVVAKLRMAGKPDYDENVTSMMMTDFAVEPENGETGGETDELYDRALRFVTETRKASISAVQRQLRIGYNRAARMIEAMEMAGVVGPPESNGKREVLAPPPPES